MDTISRLKQFIDFIRLTSTQFADKADIPRPSLSQILSGRNKKISTDLVQKIHVAFPELNILWLLYGEGPMTLSSTSTHEEDSVPMLNFDTKSGDENNQSPTPYQPPTPLPVCHNSASLPDPATGESALALQASKKVESIMVFYTDNSFEIFKKV